MSSSVLVGDAVEVPLGHRWTWGFVVEVLTEDKAADIKFSLKDIKDKKRDYPFFLPDQLALFQWISDYYGQPLSNVIDVAVPPIVPPAYDRFIVLKDQKVDPEKEAGRVARAVLSYLLQNPGRLEYQQVMSHFRTAAPVLRRLEKKGIIAIEEDEQLDSHVNSDTLTDWAKTSVSLTKAQEQAVAFTKKAAEEHKFSPILLHGITGSGKTEVYIEAIKEIAALGMGSLVIVPEIALTPQLIDRFRSRLGNQIAVLHSAVHKRARWDAWRALVEGRNTIAIGVRSGIFAPVKNLGLIVVDEEHDGSYKQGEGLRYHARDLAVIRAKLRDCPVLLGSATPSLESWLNALNKKYHYYCLPTRPSGLSQICLELVDLNKTRPWEMASKNVSRELSTAIGTTVERGEQVFILYNRRGFARYLQCERCEETIGCPNCSVTMTYHQNGNTLLCHYCGYSLVPPKLCTSCCQGVSKEQQDIWIRKLAEPVSPVSKKRSSKKEEGDESSEKPNREPPLPRYVLRGSGTEKVFDELKEMFPGATIDRLDRDAVNDLDGYKNILERVRSGATSILVGTQMIAKGHDLPGVTLVGVVDCDVGLHIPDFRASERVFQLLTQASGRAGRGSKPGRVILQTRVPEHASLVHTVSKNFPLFAKGELKTREFLQYPPFTRLLRIIVSSEVKELPQQVLDGYRRVVEELCARDKLGVQILGPAPAPLEKLKSSWRWHILLKAKSMAHLNKVLTTLQAIKVHTTKVRIIFDVDPQDTL